MNAKDLKTRVDSLTQDISFIFNGIECSIIPINRENISVSYGEHRVKDYGDSNAMMEDPFWDGKSLNEIAGEIELI